MKKIFHWYILLFLIHLAETNSFFLIVPPKFDFNIYIASYHGRKSLKWQFNMSYSDYIFVIPLQECLRYIMSVQEIKVYQYKFYCNWNTFKHITLYFRKTFSFLFEFYFIYFICKLLLDLLTIRVNAQKWKCVAFIIKSIRSPYA